MFDIVTILLILGVFSESTANGLNFYASDYLPFLKLHAKLSLLEIFGKLYP